MLQLAKIIGINSGTMGLIVAGIGIGVVVGVGVCVWRNTALREKLLVHLANCNKKIESLISLIRRQPEDPWYIKSLKFLLGLFIIKTISQFILLPIVNWCLDIIITYLGNNVTLSKQIFNWLSQINFSILSQIDWDSSTLITLIYGLIDFLKLSFESNWFKLSMGEPYNSSLSSRGGSPSENLYLLMERNPNRAIASSSSYDGLYPQRVAYEDISTDNLDQFSGQDILALNARLQTQRTHLMSRARQYTQSNFESLDVFNRNSDYSDYNRHMFHMHKHYLRSKKVLDYLESRGGHMYNFDRQSFERFKDLFGELVRRH